MSITLLITLAAILIGAALIGWAVRQRNLNASSAGNSDTAKHKIIRSEEHQIPRQRLDDNALKVVYRLQDAGYEGYLVGGCIRDLLLGKRPKDFDVATSAHPEEAVELFRRGRLIGRRFRLLHVRFGREIIEVATFRAGHDNKNTNENGEHGRQADSGMIVRDNVYGNIDDDAMRRDFTINALYFDPQDNSVHDFAGGYKDIQQGLIRMIGEPEERYREDPVRMLRAARFAAKLDFQIEPKTAAPIPELAELLRNIAPARLFDESLKLFQSGHGMATYEQLKKYDLFRQLYPQTQWIIDNTDLPAEAILMKALSNTDKRLAQRKSVTPAFLYAALLWHPMQYRMRQLMEEQKMPAVPALHEAANQVIGQQVRSTAIPRRFSTPLREIWELQLRLPRRHGNKADRLMEHPRFRAAYDLLLLREASGEQLDGLGEWWTDYQRASLEQRSAMLNELGRPEYTARKKRRPRRRKAAKSNNRD